jgi:hypothetical protein
MEQDLPEGKRRLIPGESLPQTFVPVSHDFPNPVGPVFDKSFNAI